MIAQLNLHGARQRGHLRARHVDIAFGLSGRLASVRGIGQPFGSIAHSGAQLNSFRTISRNRFAA